MSVLSELQECKFLLRSLQQPHFDYVFLYSVCVSGVKDLRVGEWVSQQTVARPSCDIGVSWKTKHITTATRSPIGKCHLLLSHVEQNVHEISVKSGKSNRAIMTVVAFWVLFWRNYFVSRMQAHTENMAGSGARWTTVQEETKEIALDLLHTMHKVHWSDWPPPVQQN